MTLDDFVVRDNLRSAEAPLCHGLISVKCSDLWIDSAGHTDDLDLPWFRKEVPVAVPKCDE